MSENTEEKPKKARKPKTELAPAPPKPSLRNENGLLSQAQHEYDQYGFINWRKLVSPEHIVLNKIEMGKAGVKVETLSKEEREKYLSTVGDEKKLIKLAGFRELARIRGIQSVSQMITPKDGVVYCECSIDFLPNIETNFESFRYTAVASASVQDVAPSFSSFLAAIASNRAFGRCIREALGISVVTEEEMNPNEEVKIVEGPNKPLALVKEKCQEKNISFETLLKYLEGKGLSDPAWISFETLDVSAAFHALEGIKNNCA